MNRLEDLIYQWRTIAALSDSPNETRAFNEAADDLTAVLEELYPDGGF